MQTRSAFTAAATRSISAAEKDIQEWLHSDHTVASVLHKIHQHLHQHTRLYLVGGAIRDRLLRKTSDTTDLDFVVDGMCNKELRACFLDNAQRNRRELKSNFYQGISTTILGRHVDIWGLEDTYHLQHFGLDATYENFLAGAPFNLDKAMYDVDSHHLYERGFLLGLREQMIVYHPAHRYLEHIQAKRCRSLMKKTEFSLHRSASELLNRMKGYSKNKNVAAEVRRYARGKLINRVLPVGRRVATRHQDTEQ